MRSHAKTQRRKDAKTQVGKGIRRGKTMGQAIYFFFASFPFHFCGGMSKSPLSTVGLSPCRRRKFVVGQSWTL